MADVIQAARNEADESGHKANFQNSSFGNIPAAFIVSAVILYVAGWGYLYGFYSAFGVSLMDLGLDLHQTMMFSSKALPLRLVAALVAALVLYIALEFTVRLKKPSGGATARALHASFSGARLPGSAASICIALLLLSVISRASIQRGRSDADCEMKAGCTHLPLARLVIDRAKLPGQLLLGVGADNSLQGSLLVHGRTGYYVFRGLTAHPKIPGLPRTNLVVSFVPDQVVLAAEITTALTEEK